MIQQDGGPYDIKIDNKSFSWGVNTEEEKKDGGSNDSKKVEEEKSILQEDKSNATIDLDNSKATQ